jgi:microcompartment protein CcmK/EutM
MANSKKSAAPSPETSLLALVKAGLDLGVTEAARRMAEHAPRLGEKVREVAGTGLVMGGQLSQDLGRKLRQDPESLTHLVKEVWSRGGMKEKLVAAEAIGRGLGKLVPHQAVTAARELARMARNAKEADLVGHTGLAPILEKNPAMVDRVRAFMDENEVYVRRAAMAALLQLVARNKKYTALAAEALLLVAESKEQEIRSAMKAGLKSLASSDPKATARKVVAWAKSEPNQQRVAMAKQVIKDAPTTLKVAVEKIVFSGLDIVANGSKSKPTSKRAPAKKPKTKAKTTKRKGAKRGRA